MRRLPMLALVLVLAAVAAFVFLRYGRPIEVATVAAQRGDAAEIVYATGVVEPATWAKVAPLVRERIVSLCDCEGERVASGDELARLDDREPQATLAELVARERYAMRELVRLQDLFARNVGTRADLELGESEGARASALVAAQRVRLGSYVLRAPIDGVVLRRDGEVGEVAEPGTALFWVGQPTPLVIFAEVNEEDIPRVAVGQRTLLRADAFPDRPLEAQVERITPKGDPVAKTYRVRFELPADTPLMIGMTVEANVVTAVSEATLLVPAAAVTPDGAVFVVEDGVARRRPVTLGIRGAVEVEVASGLSEGEAVISPAPADLADGDRVRVAGPTR